MHVEGLSLAFRAHWIFNFVHALFDGLYPAYVALAKFGLQHERFRVLILGPEADGCVTGGRPWGRNRPSANAMACSMTRAFRRFGGCGPVANQDVLNSSRSWRFETLVLGSQTASEYTSGMVLLPPGPHVVHSHTLPHRAPS